jgi:hypothetical protein
VRVLALIVVAVLAAATFVVPQPSRPVPRVPDGTAPAPYSVCPLGEAAQRSTVLAFVGGDQGAVTASVFSGGDIAATGDVAISETGTGVLDLSEMTGLARAPVLIGLDDSARAVETILGGSGVAAAACGPGSGDAQVVLGGATAEGETYTLVLANPFAGSATVNVQVASEVGAESDPALEGVVVPPRSVVAMDMGNLLPGRQSMSAAVVATRGRVVAGGVHQSSDRASAMGGIEAALDWYVPVPGLEDAARSLVLYAPGTSDVPFQLDVYGPEGLVEAAFEDVVPAQGQVEIRAGDLLEGPGMVRVVAAGQVAAALKIAGEPGRAVMPGVSTPAPTWLLPGAGRVGDTRIHVFNPGGVDVAASLLSDTGEEVESFEVPASTTVDVALPSTDVGARLEADGDVVVHWTTVTEEGVAGDAARAPAG